mmetsp:Transcript_20996/g.42655  ORF Transcript_20996/g.42655 Transcript_20996/m.42655 type:complete len:386 (+) Transcript_20996:219-1376(+)
MVLLLLLLLHRGPNRCLASSTHTSRHRPAQLAHTSSDEVGDVHGHLLDLGVVELLDVAHVAHVVARHKVDGNALTTETPRAPNPVDVVLPVGGEVVVDDQRHLLHVNATREEIGGDEHAGGAGAELAHDELSPLLVHVAVKCRHREIAARHLLEQPVHLPAGVDVDDGLRDGERFVEVAKRLELPFLPLHRNVELLDSLERELVLLDEDAHGVAHEVPRDLEHLDRHCRREESHLHLARQEFEHVVDLVLEPARKHLVSLVEHEDLHRVRPQRPPVDHVVHAPGGSHHHLLACLKPSDVLPDVGPSDARVALRRHVVAQCEDNLLNLLGKLAGRRKQKRLTVLERHIHALKATNGESGRLASPRLRLGDSVTALDQGKGSPLLDS